MFTKYLWISARLLAALTIVTGVLYPMLVTLVAQLAYPQSARGNLVSDGERVLGSRWIGQAFTSPRYFWGRPSSTQPPYDASASGGSNLSPASDELERVWAERVRALQASHPGQSAAVPADLVCASGSGLDPHISPQAARWQMARVASERGLSLEALEQLVREHTHTPIWSLLGGARVNVLELNLALDRIR